MPLDRMITLPDAIQKYGLTENRLRALAEKGKIRAGLLSSGEIVVSEQDAQAQKPVSKEELDEYKKHAQLKGVAIWASEAARKYNIPQPTLFKWTKAGYIKKLHEDGYKVFLDEADVAYCADIYRNKHGGQGKRLFNSDGTPYKLKREAKELS